MQLSVMWAARAASLPCKPASPPNLEHQQLPFKHQEHQQLPFKQSTSNWLKISSTSISLSNSEHQQMPFKF